MSGSRVVRRSSARLSLLNESENRARAPSPEVLSNVLRFVCWPAMFHATYITLVPLLVLFSTSLTSYPTPLIRLCRLLLFLLKTLLSSMAQRTFVSMTESFGHLPMTRLRSPLWPQVSVVQTVRPTSLPTTILTHLSLSSTLLPPRSQWRLCSP